MSKFVMVKLELLERITKEPCSTDDQVDRQDAVDKLRAVLAQEAGRGEVVAYRIQAFSKDGHLLRHALSWRSLAESMELADFKGWIGEYRAEETPLYTSPPAPVSVVLPERRDLSKKMFDEMSPSERDISFKDIGWNACLDKVKELNQ